MFRLGRNNRIARLFICAVLAALSACSDQPPTAPVAAQDDASDFLFSSRPKLLECESTETFTTKSIIGSLGGVIAIGGTSVEFPANLLGDGTEVTLTIPASPYVEIDITTNGQNQFLDPLLRPIVTISYARCDRNDLWFRRLSAWYIDSDTKELLEKQLSFDNKLTRSVTFRAKHFTGYAIAF